MPGLDDTQAISNLFSGNKPTQPQSSNSATKYPATSSTDPSLQIQSLGSVNVAGSNSDSGSDSDSDQ